MASYAQVYRSFWTDAKVDENFTSEDKFFYLYLITNPHTSICGCYDLTVKQMVYETGLPKEKIEELIDRMENEHDVMRYSRENREVLLLNWHKYNWSSSEKTIAGILSASEKVKTQAYKEYIIALANGEEAYKPDVEQKKPHGYPMDTPSIPHPYPIISTVTVIDTDTVSVSDTVSVNQEVEKEKDIEREKEEHAEKVIPISQKKPTVRSTKATKAETNLKLLDELCPSFGFSDMIIAKLNEWMRYKAETFSFAYKPSGAKALLNEVDKNLRDYGDEAVSNVINLSMSNGWMGITWDKIQSKNGRASPASRYQNSGVTFADMLRQEFGENKPWT